MTKTLKQPEKEVAHGRPCTSCGERFEASRLAWAAGQWFCSDCHLEWKVQQEEVRQRVRVQSAVKLPPVERQKLFERIHSVFHLGSGFLRFGAYGAGVYLATKHDFVNQCLHGVVLADILTWIALCYLDACFTKLPVILEFIGFVILSTIILSGAHSEVFENSATMGMAFLGFLITFGTKGVYRLHRHWNNTTSLAE